MVTKAVVTNDIPIKKAKRKRRPILDFPAPKWTAWIEPETFHEALTLQMARHGETHWYLHKAITRPEDLIRHKTIAQWASGATTPRAVTSFNILSRIEHRYRLSPGYFKAKLAYPNRAATGHTKLASMKRVERRRLAWHLPEDFEERSSREKSEILGWVQRVIISGTTEYRRFQAEAVKHPFAMRFSNIASRKNGVRQISNNRELLRDNEIAQGQTVSEAPAVLAMELGDFVNFKMLTLTPVGQQRLGIWSEETALKNVTKIGLLFGALIAPSKGRNTGLDVRPDDLCFALLAFPSLWDWYIQWRERRRGFFSVSEKNMLRIASSLVCPNTGWLRQNPQLSERLTPISGLISGPEIDTARLNWEEFCEKSYRHLLTRIRDIRRVSKIHRDPFEPILPILESDNPIGEYRKITEEVIRRMPDPNFFPKPEAEAIRSFLMLRFALHLGVRQKNLRQLLFCKRGDVPKSLHTLDRLKTGELRWSKQQGKWEVLIPVSAFKNYNSAFFNNNPLSIFLPDLGNLYHYIDRYIYVSRPLLLRGFYDCGTFFVKTTNSKSHTVAYDSNSFYENWRLIIEKYGIYNPYTGQGAIRDLLPHGPHCIRDVLATHVLKMGGSYEQAGYAIQSVPKTAQTYYARFLPKNKAEIAGNILNRAWGDA